MAVGNVRARRSELLQVTAFLQRREALKNGNYESRFLQDDPDLLAELLRLQTVVCRSLLHVGSSVELPGTPELLSAVDLAEGTVVAVAGREGWISLVQLEDDGLGAPLPPVELCGFVPGADELICLFADRKPLSAHTDIYLAVRRWSTTGKNPQSRLYRAVAWRDGDQGLKLMAGTDGLGVQAGGGVHPEALGPEGLPGWLRTVPIVFPPGCRPLRHPPPDDLDSWRQRVKRTPTLGVAWDGSRLIWRTASRDLVVQWTQQDGESDAVLVPVGHAPRGLAVQPQGDEVLVVACSPIDGVCGRILSSQNQAKSKWWQPSSCQPVCVAVVGTCEGESVDLVVGTQGGTVQRFRRVDRSEVKEFRDHTQEALNKYLKLSSLPQWQRWIAGRLGKTRLSRGQTDKLGRLLIRMLDTSAAQGDRGTDAAFIDLADMLVGEHFADSAVPMGHALASLVSHRIHTARQRAIPAPFDDDSGVQDAVRLARRAYRQAPFALQEELDRRLAALSEETDIPEGSALGGLLKPSDDNHWDLLQQHEEGQPAVPYGADQVPVHVDFLTEMLLYERQDRSPGRMDIVCAVSDERSACILAAGPSGLRQIELKTQGKPSFSLKTFGQNLGTAPPGFAPAGFTPLGAGCRLLREATNRAWLCTRQGLFGSITGPPDSTCGAAVALPPGPAQSGGTRLFVLAWNQGRRAFLELRALQPGVKPSSKRVWLHALDLHNVACLALAPGPKGMASLVAGDALSGRLCWLAPLTGDDKPEISSERQLDSGVTALCTSASQALLVAGTERGHVWAYEGEDRTLAWTFRARNGVKRLLALDRVRGHEGVLVLAPPDDLVLLSDGGKRAWRRHHGGRFRDVAVLPGTSGAPLRVVLAIDGDLAMVLRKPEPEPGPDAGRVGSLRRVLRAVEAALIGDDVVVQNALESPRGQEALAVALAATCDPADAAQVLSTTRYRRARLVLVEVMADSPPPAAGAAAVLESLTQRELWTLCRALPDSPAGPWWAPLVDEVMSRPRYDATGDGSGRTRRVAVIELMRRAIRMQASPAELGKLMRRVPADLQAESDPWVAIEAGRAWLSSLAVAEDKPVAELRLDLLLAHVHHLPPALAQALPLLVQEPFNGRVLAILARWAGSSTPPALHELDSVGKELAEKADNDVSRLLAQSLLLTARSGDPNWRELLPILELHHQLTDSSTPWAQPLAAQLDKLALGLPPGDPAPLHQQAAWLSKALTSVEPGPADWPRHLHPWARLSRYIGGRVLARLRSGLRRQLDEVKSTTRLRPQVQGGGRPEAGRVDLVLELVPEGRRSLRDATINVSFSVDSGLRPIGRPLCWTFQRKELNQEEPSQRVDVMAFCAPETTKAELRIHVAANDGWSDRDEHWSISLPAWQAPTKATGLAAFPDAVPTAFQALVAGLKRRKQGVALVVADPVVDPNEIARVMSHDGATRIVDFDALLLDLGPGRKYPSLLGRAALCLALSGLDLPDDDTVTEPEQVDFGDSQRLIFYPCTETIQRLLHPDLGPAWQHLHHLLREHAQASGHGCLVFVLPSDLAARFRRKLDLDPDVFTPATLESRTLGDKAEARAEEEARTWLDKHAQIDKATASEVLEAAGADLRIMHDWLLQVHGRRAPRPDLVAGLLRTWGRRDLLAFTPEEVLALLLLSLARTRRSLKKLEPGLVIYQDIRSKPRAAHSQPKQITHSGMVLTERSIRRLRNLASGPRQVLVGGFEPGSNPELPSEGQALARLLPGRLREKAQRLEKRGLVERRGGVYQPRALLQCVISSRVEAEGSLAAAYRDLVPGARMMDGIELDQLAELNNATAQALGLELPAGRVEVLQRVGSLWSDSARGVAPQATLSAGLTRTLTGHVCAVVGRSQGVDHGPACLFAPLGGTACTLVGADPIGTQAGHRTIFAWLGGGAEVRMDALKGLMSRLSVLQAKTPAPGEQRKGDSSLLVLLGPGAEILPVPPRTDGVVVLRQRDLRQVLVAANLADALWASIQAHTGMAAIAPFVVVGALPPGSSLFVGRNSVREEIRAGIHRASFLVVGPRRIGKTSLLHAVYEDLRADTGVPPGDLVPMPLLLSMQGIVESSALAGPLRALMCRADQDVPEAHDVRTLMRNLVQADRQAGRRTVFVINEIDGLLEQESSFFGFLRSLAEDDGARFVMGGYAGAHDALNRVESPLFHMTTGRQDGQYFTLAALEVDEALELVDKLEAAPLRLRWAGGEAQREAARDLLVSYSYAIPWVLQALCQKLVRLLDRERRADLRLDDVRRVAEDARPVLEHFDRIDYGELIGRRSQPAVDRAVQAMLAALAAEKYFRGKPPPITQPRLAHADPSAFAFTAAQALQVLLSAVSARLGAPDQPRAQAFLAGLDLPRLLRGLTLTLILVQVGSKGEGKDPRYAFQAHIYPRELYRQGGVEGADQRVSDALHDLLPHLTGAQ